MNVDRYVEGVRAGDRVAIGRAITLVESRRDDHQRLAAEMVGRLLPAAGGAHRIGITGVPGAGKSTFIEAVGMRLVDEGRRVAVLAVDPTSSRTGGSILGDKTRMTRLAASEHAFIRPSPSGGRLGGVTGATRETIVVLEAAGYDVVFVETVGVGQSETAVAAMVDTFVLLMLARSGDSLQGLKKGVLELADVIAVNKADGDRAAEAAGAAAELAAALHLVAGSPDGWSVPVLTCSGLTGTGLDAVWGAVEAHRRHLDGGGLDSRRKRQDVEWMWATIDDRLLARFRGDPAVRAEVVTIEAAVGAGTITPAAGARRLLDLAE